jgi:hypothetical protein
VIGHGKILSPLLPCSPAPLLPCSSAPLPPALLKMSSNLDINAIFRINILRFHDILIPAGLITT